MLHEDEITEASVIDVLAPEKSLTRSFIPMANQPVSAPMLITFKTNSADSHSAKQTLDKVGRALNMDKLAEFNFVIEAHADLSGSYQLNQSVSKARAETVMNYLVQMHGIEPNRLTAIGKYTALMNKDKL